jgi:hypothetical protein
MAQKLNGRRLNEVLPLLPLPPPLPVLCVVPEPALAE